MDFFSGDYISALRGRVVNIAIKVSLSLVSAILLEYRHQYCRYFLKASIAHGIADTFSAKIAILISDT